MNGTGDGDCIVPVFSYSAEEVPLFREVGNTASHHSELDRLLRSRWAEAMGNGVFRYNLSDVTTRMIPGKFGFIAQRNPKRFSHRRAPADTRSLTQPFDPTLFNFNKIKGKEILFELQSSSSSSTDKSAEQCKDKRHLAIVNVSPIEFGHMLLVPEPNSCLPQVMTRESIQLCIELVALSGHSGFCMVSNSLLAYASVNHLHYHFLYLDHPLQAASVGGRRLAGGCYELDFPGPIQVFGFQLDVSAAQCAREIHAVVSILLENNLPHHLVMLRGEPFAPTRAPDGTKLVRILLIPRKPVYGFKKLYENGGESIPPFFAAACEMGLGFIPVYDHSSYPDLTEKDVLQILGEVRLTPREVDSVKEMTKLALTNNVHN